jgi:hypothetical protein
MPIRTSFTGNIFGFYNGYYIAGTAIFFEAFATSFYQFYSPLYATYAPICFVIAS